MNTFRSVVLVTASTFVLVASACSSATYRSGAGSGVLQSKKLTDLDAAELGRLCDYFAAQFGGYGASATQTCDGGSSTKSAPSSRATCVEGLSGTIPASCPVTVSETEACFAALGARTCESSALPPSCSLLAEPVCGPLLRSSTTVTTDTEAGAPEAGADSSVGNACPGNTKQKTTFINATCQSALEHACCAELRACFDVVPAGGQSDCNMYSACIPACRFKSDGVTPETDAAKIGACQDDCDATAPNSVRTAYDAIAKCATDHSSTSTACQ